MTGTALRHPNEFSILAIPCDSSNVAEGSVLVPSTSNNDAAALPAGADTAVSVLGLAYKAGSSTANQRIEIVMSGVYPGVANVAITRGNKVTVASAAGDLKPVTAATAPGATVVGTAMESCNAGERVAIMIGDGAQGGYTGSANPQASGQVRLVSISNVNLTTGLVAGQTIDSVTLVAGDRVLLVSQTTASQNGVYVATAAGAASYAADYATGLVASGQTYHVTEGTSFAGTQWKATAANPLTIGTTDPLFYPRLISGIVTLAAGSGAVSNLFIRSTSSGLSVVDQTAAAAVKCTMTAGRGTGSLSLTGTSTDNILWTVINF